MKPIYGCARHVISQRTSEWLKVIPKETSTVTVEDAVELIEERIGALAHEIRRLLPATSDTDHNDDAPVRPVIQRAKPALKTSEGAFARPILEVLVELGRSGNVNDVIERVYAKMKDQLNHFDHTLLPSDGKTPRRRNTAQLSRNTLREKGHIGGDSPHGTWVITEAGRAWLQSQA